MEDTVRINLRKTLFILPNLFTLSSIYCGFHAIVLSQPGASEDDFYRASLLIIFAMFFDAIDGRVARLTKTQSAFGVEIDSLADVVSFGVAPALLVYNWALHPLGSFGIIAAFAYLACGAIRLARFNVLAMNKDGTPDKPGKYIVGLPIPGAAGILVSLVVFLRVPQGPAIPTLVVLLLMGFFMVSTIRFRSFKDLRMNWRTVALVSFAAGSSGYLALKVHMAAAVGWLLLCYVLIAMVESVLSLGRRLRHRRHAPDVPDVPDAPDTPDEDE